MTSQHSVAHNTLIFWRNAQECKILWILCNTKRTNIKKTNWNTAIHAYSTVITHAWQQCACLLGREMKTDKTINKANKFTDPKTHTDTHTPYARLRKQCTITVFTRHPDILAGRKRPTIMLQRGSTANRNLGKTDTHVRICVGRVV